MHHDGSGPARRRVALVCLLGLVAAGCAGDPAPADPAPDGAPGIERLDGVSTVSAYDGDAGLDRWRAEVPGIEEVEIPSTADGATQPALWQPPTGDGPQPLLVALHSWSADHEQHNGIPFARLAEQRGWGMIHPDFRGVFETPEATGSDLAVQDVLDAVDFAAEQAPIDPDQVFAVGFSGGGMMSLLMAGRHPDRFAGAAAWVPIDDLVDWYGYHEDRDTAYAEQIRASCGGDPLVEEPVAAECAQRSPTTHLDAAREAGVPVYLAHGIDDETVPPHNSARAFNRLARPEDRLPDDVTAALRENTLPTQLRGEIDGEAYFGSDDPEVLFVRESGPVTLVLFDGAHDMAFHPGLDWMVQGLGAP